MAAPGTYKNPALKQCWETCGACGRCDKKDTNACPERGRCSGRFDPQGVIDYIQEDWCDCKNGVLRWKPKQGRTIVVRYTHNPFGGKVNMRQATQDESDWEAYLNDQREKLNDPHFNPVKVTQ